MLLAIKKPCNLLVISGVVWSSGQHWLACQMLPIAVVLPVYP